jgi:acetyltransferase-like isoleucine patch superfamily enzyme
MLLRRILNSLYKKVLERSGSDKRISYLRKHGMKIGECCHFETLEFSTEPYLIEIGDHVGIALGTVFITHDGGVWCFRKELVNGDIFGRIKVGNNVFIGTNCTILPNTIIGDNCIVGAGSVLRGKFPDNSVIIGNPARVVTNMNMQKFLYKQNPGFMTTNNLTDKQKKQIVKKHFGLE